ncbi:hypothetical protein ACO0K9_20540 [Undibacterium sp. Ji50W]|uniref:hypothetical protein n=1 Tax=Undibacterium sp. Ji50W TaxID=3413041 RepID=UPI003BF30B58
MISIRFNTNKFDVTLERTNPINPIHGESLLIWLREQAMPGVEVSEPDAEDWGWYSYVDWKGRAYLLGSASTSEGENGEREWVLLFEKQRTLKEKLLGRAKMTKDDACMHFFKELLEREPAFSNMSEDDD